MALGLNSVTNTISLMVCCSSKSNVINFACELGSRRDTKLRRDDVAHLLHGAAGDRNFVIAKLVSVKDTEIIVVKRKLIRNAH